MPRKRRTYAEIDADLALSGPDDRRDPERPNTPYRQSKSLPKRHPKTKGVVGQEMLAALLWIACRGEPDRRRTWKEGRLTPAKTIEGLVGKAGESPLHAEIDALLERPGQPPVKTSNLYTTDFVGKPLYRMSIRRGEDGLWRTSSARVLGAAFNAKDGVLLTFPRGSDPSDRPTTRPSAARVWGGGIDSLAGLAAEAVDPEFRRMLSHAWIVALFIGGCSRRSTLPVYLTHGGRVDFRVLPEEGSDGWTSPMRVEPARSRPYVSAPPRAGMVVYGDANGDRMDVYLPRYALFRIDPRRTLGGLEAEGDVDDRLVSFGLRAFGHGLLPLFAAVRRYVRDEYVDRTDAARDPEALREAHAAGDPTVLLRRRGERYQEWAAPSYVAADKRVRPYVVRLARYVDDAEPKVHVVYDEETMLPTGELRPSRGLLSVYADVLAVHTDHTNAKLPATRRQRGVILEVRATFGMRTLADAKSLFARHRVALVGNANRTLEQAYA